MKSDNAFVSIQNVTKKYNDLYALHNVSLDIKEGEVFGYIGPNGAGKTTTMKILVGLISDFQGKVRIGDYKMPAQKDEIHKLLGYLPQNVAFQEWRTIKDSLKIFGKLSGLDDQEIEKRIPDVLDLLDLTEVCNKKISKLSGGMTQKVGLAQALLHDPKLLILDEPLNGLDPLSRQKFKEIVKKLSKKGTTILFSSHILSDVQDVADVIGILNHGKLVQFGSLNQLKQGLSIPKTIEVLLSTPSDKWQELGKIKGTHTIEQTAPDKIILTLQSETDPDEAINSVGKAIVDLGINIRGISLLSPSIDEIYLNYIQRGQAQ
ncbi:MAG: ABC transporter ATP-binding protein [Nitrososphaerota archaeon]|jgi:ABC-2 type transport system ATP-binding protein|nr:ABC transporter ATP-binding protein [Nitrososphaerota archaeon]